MSTAVVWVGGAGRNSSKVLPGFNITLGFTVLYLSLIVLIPLSALLFKTFTLSWEQFWTAVTGPRVLASYRLTFGASFLAALTNVFFGLLVAWVLVRYDFFGKKVVDALVDLPFALPTAVAGISLTALLAGNGWIGQYLEPHGIQLAFTPNGVLIALILLWFAQCNLSLKMPKKNWKKRPRAWELPVGKPSLGLFSRPSRLHC
jgi:sulfate transport system permease protein